MLVLVKHVLISVLKCHALNSFSAEDRMLKAVIDVESPLLSVLVGYFFHL